MAHCRVISVGRGIRLLRIRRQWLAQAVQVARSSGRVEMMIVWNVDFTTYSASDPMAGYAILRPGGSCPACDALARAVG